MPPINNHTVAIILAAGNGSRFGSDTPKVLHPIQGVPMLHRIIQSVRSAGVSEVCVVVGAHHKAIRASCDGFSITYAMQDQPLGTGHALRCALISLRDQPADQYLVLPGDCPMIQPQTLCRMMETAANVSGVTLLTSTLPDAGAYGRIIRNQRGDVTAIQESKDCTHLERSIQEFNSGIYCFDRHQLEQGIQTLTTNNAQAEYYLTDVIAYFFRKEIPISSVTTPHHWEVCGVNTPDELANLTNMVRSTITE